MNFSMIPPLSVVTGVIYRWVQVANMTTNEPHRKTAFSQSRRPVAALAGFIANYA